MPPGRDKGGGRAARLAVQLRANLRRRKQHGREGADATETDTAGPAVKGDDAGTRTP